MVPSLNILLTILSFYLNERTGESQFQLVYTLALVAPINYFNAQLDLMHNFDFMITFRGKPNLRSIVLIFSFSFKKLGIIESGARRNHLMDRHK